MDIAAKLAELGLELPKPAAPVAAYVPVVEQGGVLHISGQLPFRDGQVVTGRLVNQGGGKITINTNMLDPNALEHIKTTDIEELKPASVSMMPKGLLDSLHEDEVLDLMAFLLSRGNPRDAMFKK